MADIKKNIWIIALIAGILGLVSIFVPAWSYQNENFVWFWNMFTSDGDIDFIDTEEALYDIGIATTIILVIGTVITLLSAIIAKLKESKNLNLILYLIGGILLLIAPIIYFGATEAEYEGFWDFYDIQIGIILPFIASGLAVLAGVYGLINQRS